MAFQETGLFPAPDVRKGVFFSCLTLLKELLAQGTL